LNANFHLPVRIGRWNTPSHPLVILIDYLPLFPQRDALYLRIWDHFHVDSLDASPEYDHACLFSIAAAQLIESVTAFSRFDPARTLAHFNEWTLAMGLLHLRLQLPSLPSVFTTHATALGRAVSGNNLPLYDDLGAISPDDLARQLGVQHKHALEKAAASHASCFTTVSQFTANECTRLLGITPHVVTPNGFDFDLVPSPSEIAARRNFARDRLLHLASVLTGSPFPPSTLLLVSSGRYEYRSKGLDLLLKSLSLLHRHFDRPAIAFIAVPADVKDPRADLLAALKAEEPQTLPLQEPFISHWLNHQDQDPILNYIHQLGIDNLGPLKVIFIPTYLDGRDGILNLTYCDFLSAADLSLFPSYYEPWGYTPLESIAFGVPTVTSALAGFGLWAQQFVDTSSLLHGVAVIDRHDRDFDFDAQHLADLITLFAAFSSQQIDNARTHARLLAANASWSTFISAYLQAFRLALQNIPSER
jgi:glycosyltransferase involved in cell wall biosynthesis